MSLLEKKLGALNEIKFGLLIVLFSILFGFSLPCIVWSADPPKIKTAQDGLHSGAIGEKYEFNLKAIDGEGDLTWSEVTPGSLATMGLFLSPTGKIHGTLTSTATPPIPEIKIEAFEIEVKDSASTPRKDSRKFVLTAYKDKVTRENAINASCFYEGGDKNLIGDLTSNISVGPTVTTQLFRYNLATEKASFNTPGLGIGAAFRFYTDNDMDPHPVTGSKSITNIKPSCRATTFNNFDNEEYKASSLLSLSPVLFASVDEAASGGSQEINLQPAIVAGFLRDLINVGVGFNLSGRSQGEVFLLLGIGTGFMF